MIKKNKQMGTKVKNSVYNSFWGGYGGWVDPINGERSKREWQYHCFYDKLKITYSRIKLKDGWIHRSIHWNNVNNGGIAWNFHIAYRKKFPFIKIGFNNIKYLYID